MTLTKIDDRGLKTPINLLDNEKIRLGAGNDLQIFHDGTNSFISDTGSGALRIVGSQLLVRNAADNENMIVASQNGAVELYHNNVKRLETNGVGVKVGGDILVGNGTDLEIKDDSGSETLAKFKNNGAVELYHDNEKKLNTKADGVLVQDMSSAGAYLTIATNAGNQGHIYGTANTLGLLDSQQHYLIKGVKDGAAELYYDNSKKLETTSTGTLTTGFADHRQDSTSTYSPTAVPSNVIARFNNESATNNSHASITLGSRNGSGSPDKWYITCASQTSSFDADLAFSRRTSSTDTSEILRFTNDGYLQIPNDSGKIQLGASQDLQIYHNSGFSYIDAQGDQLRIDADQLRVRSDSGESYIEADANSAVKLYFDNSKKLETLSGGVRIYGDLRIKDDEHIYLGDGADLEIRVGSNDDGVINQVNGDLKFQKGGSGKFTIKSDGTHFSDDAIWADSQKAIFGAGSDLQIYHDGTNSNIQSYTNRLDLRANTLHISNLPNSEDMARFNNNGSVELYYDYSKKLETTQTGISIIGNTIAVKPCKVIQNTNVTDTTGDRFQVDLPSTSRMFRLTGSFSFDGSQTYRIWGDLGGWSDSHSASLEGFANFWVDGASGDLEQDVTSGRYFEVADPVDSGNLEVTYDILITTMAHNGGARPGVSGNISWTYNGVGRAWTVFSYQDTAAQGTDRLVYWAWDIDNVSGNPGTGKHQYVLEEYPLTQ